ncbi:hypothetical protein OGAPHI_004864 [Ogataea philodendri]|uniref:Uncharacterized protein n=1 Tax=Ogataea philodendri TaxID=1378263 RepID=A0A9P8P306_9ASCO|nr:uncharacterized protein OGAPHI_004864 [Ogataea philodendri]KAH3664150.1 hypothetical protein OGAPHI_004864 [Ogataea philodendri]
MYKWIPFELVSFNFCWVDSLIESRFIVVENDAIGSAFSEQSSNMRSKATILSSATISNSSSQDVNSSSESRARFLILINDCRMIIISASCFPDSYIRIGIPLNSTTFEEDSTMFLTSAKISVARVCFRILKFHLASYLSDTF